MDDAQIGRNVARLRGGMRQKDLAAVMRGRGWKWQQATVGAIEKGERPLRVTEMVDLAAFFGRPVSNLIEPDARSVALARSHAVREAHTRMLEAMNDYDEARSQLQLSLLDLKPEERNGQMNLLADTWMPETVVRAAQKRAEDGEAVAELGWWSGDGQTPHPA